MSDPADINVEEIDTIVILASLFPADLLKKAAEEAVSDDPRKRLKMIEARDNAFTHHNPKDVSLGHLRAAILEARGECDEARSILVDTLVSAAGQLVTNLRNHGDHSNANLIARCLTELFLQHPDLPMTASAASLLGHIGWHMHYSQQER